MKNLKPKRWSISNAAGEFSLDPKTLSKAIRRESIEPGEDGKFSTVQICSAIYGDIDNEKLRLVRAQADTAEMERDKMRGELLEIETVARSWEDILLGVRQKFLGLSNKVESRYSVGMEGTDIRKLIDQEIDEILTDLSKPLVYADPDPDEEDLPPLPEKKTRGTANQRS